MVVSGSSQHEPLEGRTGLEIELLGYQGLVNTRLLQCTGGIDRPCQRTNELLRIHIVERVFGHELAPPGYGAQVISR